MYEGSCLCGSVRYTVEGEFSEFDYCHCTSCRKASGSAHAANASVERTHLHLTDTDGCLKEYESTPGKFRAFCSNCGSPVYAYLTSTPERVRIRLGSLDTAFGKTAKAHLFVSDKASWHRIEGDIPQFDKWADRDVHAQIGSRQR